MPAKSGALFQQMKLQTWSIDIFYEKEIYSHYAKN